MLTKENYDIGLKIYNKRNSRMYKKNKFSEFTHYLVELNKTDKIDQREFNALITYSASKYVEIEIKSVIDSYFNNGFSKYFRRFFSYGIEK